MKKIKSIITGILTGAVFFMAMQVGVAQEKVVASDNVEVKGSVEAHVLAGTLDKIKREKTTKLTAIYKWYPISSSTSTNPSGIVLADTEPLSQAPDISDTEGCAQSGNNGELCAVLIEFLSTATNFELDGSSLADAIDNNSDAVGIAAEDQDSDGFAKSPEPEMN